MRITRLEIRNFCRVKEVILGDDVFKVGTACMIVGKNGAGKSTIFSEAILWCIFGKTDRGPGKDEVVNEAVGKDCEVSVWVEDGDYTYRISRYRKHSVHENNVKITVLGDDGTSDDITRKDNKETNAYVQEVIGCTLLSFTNSFLFSQQSTQFFSGCTDKDQKEIVEKAAGLFTHLTDMSRAAGRLAEGKQMDKESSEEKIAELNADILSKKKLGKEAQQKETTYNADRAKEVKSKQQDLSNMKKELVIVQDSLQVVTSKETKILKKGKSLEKKKDDEFAQMEKHNIALATVKTSLSVFGVKIQAEEVIIKESNTELDRINSLDEDVTCGNCGSTITPESKDVLHSDAYGKLEKAEKRHEQLSNRKESDDKEYKELAKKILHHKELYKATIIQIGKLDKELDEFERVKKRYTTAVNSLDKDISTVTESIKMLKKAPNPHKETINSLRKIIKDIKTKISVVNETLVGVDEEVEALWFVQSMCSGSGIRSLVLKSITPFMNDRIRQYLPEGVEVTFNTQRKLKSGELREKFEVQVDMQNGSKSYEQLSGGEKNIIDMPVLLTLCSLSQCVGHSRLNILIFDELFKVLDDENLDWTLSLLGREKAERDGVFVITHNKDLADSGIFDKIITVTKIKGETKVQVDVAR